MVHEGRPWWTLSAMATKSPLRSCGSISRASTACAAFMRQYPSRRQMNRLRIASTFRAGTRNFSTLEYGALVMLMDCFWCEGKLPDDDEVRRTLQSCQNHNGQKVGRASPRNSAQIGAVTSLRRSARRLPRTSALSGKAGDLEEMREWRGWPTWPKQMLKHMLRPPARLRSSKCSSMCSSTLI